MAYKLTNMGKRPIFIGTEEDRCYLCNRALSGRECIQESDFLICLENCQGGSD